MALAARLILLIISFGPIIQPILQPGYLNDLVNPSIIMMGVSFTSSTYSAADTGFFPG